MYKYIPYKNWKKSSNGDISANKEAQPRSYYLAQTVFLQPIQLIYHEQIQQPKLNTPTSINGLSTHEKKKEFLRTSHTTVQSSIHLQGSVRISHSVGSCVYKMHYILSFIHSGTSTISTKFQALKLQIDF